MRSRISMESNMSKIIERDNAYWGNNTITKDAGLTAMHLFYFSERMLLGRHEWSQSLVTSGEKT